jgi:hypothetical protein
MIVALITTSGVRAMPQAAIQAEEVVVALTDILLA